MRNPGGTTAAQASGDVTVTDNVMDTDDGNGRHENATEGSSLEVVETKDSAVTGESVDGNSVHRGNAPGCRDDTSASHDSTRASTAGGDGVSTDSHPARNVDSSRQLVDTPVELSVTGAVTSSRACAVGSGAGEQEKIDGRAEKTAVEEPTSDADFSAEDDRTPDIAPKVEEPTQLVRRQSSSSATNDAGYAVATDEESSDSDSDCEDPAVLRQRLRRLRVQMRQLRRENAELRRRLPPEMAYREVEMDPSVRPDQLVEDIKQAAAETAAQLEGSDMEYQPETGLYYHRGSGYYWDPSQQMYYDGNTGYYLTYDSTTGAYSYLDPAAHTDGDAASYHDNHDASEDRQDSEAGGGRRTSREELEEGEIDDEEEEEEARIQREMARGRQRGMDRRKERERERARRHQHQQQPVPLPVRQPERTVFESGPSAEVSAREPPWLRMIVTQTEVRDLRLGSLYLATMDGLTVGRDPSQQLHLEDANVSKFHAVIGYDGDKNDFYIRDLGSRNGTFVDGRRISAAKQESEDASLPHRCSLRLGSTSLTCHVHAANDTCLDCEPGEMQSRLAQHVPTTASVDAREQRRQVVDAIKQKYGLRRRDGGPAPASTVALGYSDRAAERRVKKGSSHPSEKTEVADKTKPIPVKNKGFKLLQQMGWKEGQGLGKAKQGRVEPVIVKERGEKRGLGCQEPVLPSPAIKEKRKTEVWEKTQARFKKLV